MYFFPVKSKNSIYFRFVSLSLKKKSISICLSDKDVKKGQKKINKKLKKAINTLVLDMPSQVSYFFLVFYSKK